MDRGAWRATVYRVTKSRRRLSVHACSIIDVFMFLQITIFRLFVAVFILLATQRGMWDLSTLAGDGSCIPCIGSVKS